MKHLIAAAKELNNVLGIDPAIEVNSKKTNVETLKEKIKEAAELIEPETDEISVTTQQVLSELGVNPWDEEQDDANEAPEESEDTEAPEEEEPEEKPKKKKDSIQPKKDEVTSTPVVKKEPKKGKGPGIIAAIVTAIEKAGKKGITKAEILEILTKQFPERNVDSMKATIGVQVPGRISKEKFEIINKDGYYSKK